MIKLKAIRDRVIVQLDPEEKQVGKIFVLDKTDPKSQNTGVVVSLGNSPEIGESIKVGDRITWEKGLGQLFEADGVKYIQLSIYDVFAVVEEVEEK